eukprot:gene20141-22890_t
MVRNKTSASHSRRFASSTNALEKKPKVIFVLGGPGSGKGTQCERLSNEFGIRHLSAGELLRQEIQSESENGKLIDEFLKMGKIVPVEISLGLLRGAIESKPWNRYLIDGFPRNEDNLLGWNRLMPDVCDLEMVLCIDCNEAELERRILERGITSGRTDDNPAVVKRRFQSFQTETMPVLEYFRQQEDSKLVQIDGAKSVDEVYEDIKKALLPAMQQEIIDLTTQYRLADKVSQKLPDVEIESPEVSMAGRTATIRYNVKGEYPADIIKWKLVEGQWRRVSLFQ